jgi:hypothetical protein
MQHQNFSKIFSKFMSKNKVFGPGQIPKKSFFFIFFSDFLGSLYRCQIRKSGTFRTVTKGEKLNIYFKYSKFTLSTVLVLNPKSNTFSHLAPVQRPQEIEEKLQKKFYLGICTGPNTLFLGLKNF